MNLFQNIKKKYLTRAIVIGAVGGVCLGLLAVGLVLLSLKLSEINLAVGYYCLIGFGTAVIVGAVLFLALLPRDKKLAKKLDHEYELHEKVQTMVAFRGREGDVIEMQRADTSERLNSLPKKKTGAARIFKLAALPVLSVAVFLAAVFVPATPTEIVGGNTVTNWQIAALSLLIEDVNKSALTDSYKTATVGVLQGVGNDLKEPQTDPKVTVLAAITEIDGIFATQSYAPIAAALEKYESTKLFASGIENGVESYRLNVPITKYETVKDRAEALEELVGGTLEKQMAAVYKELTAEGVDLQEALSGLGKDISAALAKSGVANSDALYSILKTFAEEVPAVESDKLEKSLNTLSGTLTTQALYAQSYDRMMREFVRERLAEIFEIPSAQLPGNEQEPGTQPGTSPGEPGSEKPSEGGGYGRGDILYGSDSKVYDPYNNKFVIYGDVINEYYAMILEQIANGTFSEESEKLISDYFGHLFSGIEDDEDK